MYHLDAVVLNGEIIFSTIGKYHQPLVDFSTNQWMVSSITNEKSILHDKAKLVLLNILNRFSTYKDVFHFEFFSDGEKIIFCEIAMRPAGGGISEAIYTSWNVHLHEINVQIQLGLPFVLPFIQDKYVSIILMMSQQQGVITGFLNEDFLKQNSHFILKKKLIGDKITPSQFSSDSILNIVTVNDSIEDLEDSISDVISRSYYIIEDEANDPDVATELQEDAFKVVRVLPHDESSFTQGLLVDGSYLIEPTGLYKMSKINVIDLASGEVVKSTKLPEDIWGEGITKLNDKYYVLTFKERKVFVLDSHSLNIITTFNYEGEGWGLTTDGKSLIMSNGSDEIIFRRSDDFSVIKKIHVNFNGKTITKINDLQWIKGLIYANVWYAEMILVINPDNGQIIKWLNMAGLHFQLDNFHKQTNTLNGIAYDEVNDQVYVTGKCWSNIFGIKHGAYF